MSDTKWVYSFGDGSAEGAADMKNLLGGKGANLAEMCRLGLPVPPGLTITTEVCSAFYDNDRNYPDGLDTQLTEALASISKAVGSDFGNPENPLLVSVRSGARASMPGMMDTVLNLGMNDATVPGLLSAPGMRGLPGIVIAVLSRCIPMWCWVSGMIISRKFSMTTKCNKAIMLIRI